MRLIDADAMKADLLTVDPQYETMISWCVTVIDAQPTADVRENVHGEWEEKEIITENVIEEWQSARCSKCGKYHTTPYMYYFDNYNFCPNCGACMHERKA